MQLVGLRPVTYDSEAIATEVGDISAPPATIHCRTRTLLAVQMICVSARLVGLHDAPPVVRCQHSICHRLVSLHDHGRAGEQQC